MQTEYDFELPRGYIDDSGNIHRKGTMRLATADDEIVPMNDPRVQQNPGYVTVIILSRVITKLGDLTDIDTNVIERLFTADMAYLNDFYQRINRSDLPSYTITCPHCQQHFEQPVVDFVCSSDKCVPV